MQWMKTLTIGLAVAGFAATGGCNTGSSDSQDSLQAVHEVDHAHNDEHGHHDHGATGPHGGHLIELGDDAYHAELVHREGTDQVFLYLLDGRAAKRVAARVDEATLNLVVDGKPAQYELAALPFEDETTDRCSRFAATNAQLSGCLYHDEPIRGRLNLVIAGKPYVGTINRQAHGEQSAHDHHDHHHDAHRTADGEPKRR